MTGLRYIPAIHRITHQVGLSIASAKTLGVSQGEAHILAHLAGAGDSTIAELHTAFAHKRSTLTSILDRLADRKLVTREVSESDRRSFLIALTRTGGKLATRVLSHLAAIEERVDLILTPREQEQLAMLLARIETTMLATLAQ